MTNNKNTSSKQQIQYTDKKSGLVVKVVISTPKIALEAKITNIDMKGMVSIMFSEPIIIPGNYTKFNSGFLDIYVISGDQQMFSKEDKRI